ncbi:HET-domain-containing protein [Neofusicoccum parvum]|uniref:HET-domain-containing protein n=1 Tax=Neofusicoccum parvum TaxID=310453 RepID=A0ACB5RXY6_9PEZI|nr:HET-domain-containing protein [Neofusicoccum parvum]
MLCGQCKAFCKDAAAHPEFLDSPGANDGEHPVLSTTFRDENGKVLVPKRIVAIYHGLATDDELASTLGKCAGVDNNSTGSDPTLELARFWLRRCLRTHDGCSKFQSSPPFMPTRVLDVSGGEVRLVETKQESIPEPDQRYVALSHCWGAVQIITTKKATLQDRLTQISTADLSKTFQNAVEVTRKLSFRYLWIDSLCIVQDDGADWEKEAAQMCKIYQNATLTIAAAHAPGGDVGCFKERDGLLQLPFILDFPPTGESTTGSPARVLFTSYGRSEGVGGPEPPLYGRAWVLQEQILSARMLIFDGAQLRWECLSGHGSERSPTGGISRHLGHHKTIRQGLADAGRDYFTLPGFDAAFAARAQHQEWCYAVMDYTHRGMTQPADRLVAVAGIAAALAARTRDRYLAGLWRGLLWLGLLWSIPHEEVEYTPTTVGAFDMDRNPSSRHAAPVAPSWSWVSVTAPVVYPVPSIGTTFIQRVCHIEAASVAGTPARQTGTLRIRAHARTAYVDAVYPYAVREAEAARPDMVFRKNPTGGAKALMTHCGRSFHPNEFFLCSTKRPACRADWQLVRGRWRPDEVLDPRTEITFVAVAQQGRGPKVGTVRDGDPLQVFTIGLVPTGRVPGEYRRVGYGLWDDCAWPFWNGMEKARRRPAVVVKPGVDRTHEHHFQADALPDESVYHEAVKVQTKTLVIV